MAISWDSLVGSISFWLTPPPRQGRAKNSKFAILASAKRGRSLSRTPPHRGGYSALHGFVRRTNAGARHAREELLSPSGWRYSTERSRSCRAKGGRKWT